MTVQNSTSKNIYNGDGTTTTFPYSFQILDSTDLTIYVDGATATGFTITNVGNSSGGNVVFNTPPSVGTGNVVILRKLPITQLVDLINYGRFDPEVIETAFDRLVMIAIQLQEQSDRTIRFGETVHDGGGIEITSTVAERAGKVLAYDENGDLNVAQELGSWQGDWSTGTIFKVRDLFKDSSDNVYIVKLAHTSTNIAADLAANKLEKIIDATAVANDAAAAAASASTASTKASEAATSANAASASQSSASTSATNAAASETNAATSATNAANSALSASTSASTATTKASDANTAKVAAESARDSAENYRDELTALTTSTSTLSAGSSATSSYNSSTGVLALGIPKGDTGATGSQGATGPQGPQGPAGNLSNGGVVSGDLDFGDNVKAKFGASDDLEIYHNGSASYIEEKGTGSLYIKGTQLRMQATDGTTYLEANDGGALTIKHDGSTKLSTTSTGVDVTGTVNADALTVDGDVNIGTSSATSSAKVTIQAQGANGSDETALVLRNYSATPYTGYVTQEYEVGTTLMAEVSARRINSTNGELIFRTKQSGAISDALLIDSSGKVGIGNSIPSSRLTVGTGVGTEAIEVNAGAGWADLKLHSDATNGGSIYFNDGADAGQIFYYHPDNSMRFHTDATERFRLDSSGHLTMKNGGELRANRSGDSVYSSLRTTTDDFTRIRNSWAGKELILDRNGNLLINTTTTSVANGTTAGIALTSGNQLLMGASNDVVAYLNRISTDGAIAEFRKDGSVVGQINTTGGDMMIGTNDTGLRFDDSVNSILPWNMGTNASRDNAIDLGYPSVRFDDVYATNGTIQTSDRNEKQDIEELSDAEQRVAIACKGLMRKFRWKDAVEEKGEDARIHFGIIAQDLQAAFEAEGLDAGKYAMFISTTWWEAERVIPAVEAVEAQDAVYEEVIIPAVLDEDGNEVEPERTEQNLVSEAVEAVEAVEEHTVTDTFDTLDEAPEGAVERTRMGVRYSELLAFIIAAI